MTATVKGPVLLTLAMLAFAGMGAFVKIAGATIPSEELVFFRSFISALLLLGWVGIKRIPVMGVRRGLLIARALSGSVALFMFFYAITKISVANSMLLNQSTPIFVLPLAAILLRESITGRHILWVSTALAGVALVVKPTANVDVLPALMALGSAFFAAVAYVLVRMLSTTENPLVIVLWFNWVASAIALPVSLPRFVAPSASVVPALLGMALLATLGQVLMTVAYRYGEAGRLSIIGSLGAVFGAGFDFVVWHHLPDAATAIGGIIVIVSCSMLQRQTNPS